jgi:peptide/nickel transport system permease protein
MRLLRRTAWAVLIVVTALSLLSGFIGPHDYAFQFRDQPNARPSSKFPLGTDDLGRDRFSRLLAGCRTSLLWAPAAALVAMLIGAGVGTAAGYFGGWLDEAVSVAIDLFLSLPWLFAALTVRALLPLNVSTWASTAATFLLLAGVGWAPGARIVRASVARMRDSGHILHARVCGCHGVRLFVFHLAPNLRPVLAAQFWVLIPVFLLAEANLGLLGLGIAEPTPSIGGMLVELQNYQRIPEAPWIFAPAALLAVIIGSLHLVVSGRDTWE